MLPRRQELEELEPSAFYTAEEVKNLPRGPRNAGFPMAVLAVSHSWESAGHPDPDGRTLVLLAHAITTAQTFQVGVGRTRPRQPRARRPRSVQPSRRSLRPRRQQRAPRPGYAHQSLHASDARADQPPFLFSVQVSKGPYTWQTLPPRVAVFFDYCSLYQPPRTERQKPMTESQHEALRAALARMQVRSLRQSSCLTTPQGTTPSPAKRLVALPAEQALVLPEQLISLPPPTPPSHPLSVAVRASSSGLVRAPADHLLLCHGRSRDQLGPLHPVS